MEHESPQPGAALAGDNAATLDRLVTMLDYAEGLTILFACCNAPLLRNRLIEQARVRLAALGVTVLPLDFDQPVRNLRQTLRTRLAIPHAYFAAAKEPDHAALLHKPVIFLTGLELSIPLGASAVRLMAELNLGRELFLRDAPCPLVFWLPNYAVTAVARQAPDFWAWRSGVFEFTLEEPQRREAYARYVELDSNLAALSSLTAARKLQHQRILEGLLDDFQALPPQRTTQERLAKIQQELAALQWLQGKPQEAMALYQEALATLQALGDVRAIAVTQSKMADMLRQMGKPQEAMAIYQEALATLQALGDVRSIAVTQSKMADVLSQMGKPQEALALYQEALATLQALGDVRAIAVTQSSMADVLSQMGKPQEAMALYQESLATLQALGDVRAIAVTQANFGQFLLQEGETRGAIQMLWSAYATLAGAGYDAATMRNLLAAAKTQTLGAARFDAIWAETVGGEQPAWLADATQAVAG